jgi:hypothetical protein
MTRFINTELWKDHAQETGEKREVFGPTNVMESVTIVRFYPGSKADRAGENH